MQGLRFGQDVVLSWKGGALDCRVLATAGRYVLLRPRGSNDPDAFDLRTQGSLTYLDGMVPMGWDGSVEPGAQYGELRFCVADSERSADRRSSVRIPVLATVEVTLPEGGTLEGRMLDVSAGGMRFRHTGRIPKGATVRVRTHLSGGAGTVAIDATAVVRNSEPGITSVEFADMHQASVQDLGAWTIAVLRAALAHG